MSTSLRQLNGDGLGSRLPVSLYLARYSMCLRLRPDFDTLLVEDAEGTDGSSGFASDPKHAEATDAVVGCAGWLRRSFRDYTIN